jgi:hypothetical protein
MVPFLEKQVKRTVTFFAAMAISLPYFGTGCKESAGPKAEPAPQKEETGLDSKVIKAWGKLMQPGWYGADDFGDWRFFETKPSDPTAVPAFRWPAFGAGFEPGSLEKLPAPAAPFSLDLFASGITDAGLKDLARLDNLQALNLTGTKVTGAGMKEIAKFKGLQKLNVGVTGLSGPFHK